MMDTAGVRAGHVKILHSFVAVVVLVEVGFAAAFLVDALRTNAVYDALVADHATVDGRIVGCFVLGQGRTGLPTGRVCRADYSYGGVTYNAEIPAGQTTLFVVDPRNAADRMNVADFDKGPEETTGDLVFAGGLLAGAVAVVVVHGLHLRHRPSTRRLR
jgi:hypothetical protein